MKSQTALVARNCRLNEKNKRGLTPMWSMPLSQLFEVLFDSSVVVKYPIF